MPKQFGPIPKSAEFVAAEALRTGKPVPDAGKLSLEAANKLIGNPDPAHKVPSQADSISSADDRPPSRQEFTALFARVVALEEAGKAGPKRQPPAGKKAAKKK